MIKLNFNIYTLNEINPQAKEYAIMEHGDFLEQIGSEYEDDNGEMKIDYSRPTDDEIIESIEMNDYRFFHNGKFVKSCTYTGGHPKQGITEYTIEGEVYTINN